MTERTVACVTVALVFLLAIQGAVSASVAADQGTQALGSSVDETRSTLESSGVHETTFDSERSAAPQNETQIEGVEFEGVADYGLDGGSQPFLWQGSNHTVTVRLRTPDSESSRNVSVCLVAGNGSEAVVPGKNTSSDTAMCTDTTVTSETSTVGLSSSGWPFNATGRQSVTAVVEDEGTHFDRKTVSVVVMQKDGDLDSDGLSNRNELDQGTSVTDPDTDGDGLNDGLEVKKYGTSPHEADTDGDGARDAREVSVGTDPTVADTDTDGLSDGEELDKGYDPTDADSDGDGLTDTREKQLGTDPTSSDTDSDGLSDFREVVVGTDPTVADTDGDGLKDSRELELGTNPTVWDSDGDLLSDSDELRFGFDPTGSLSPFGYGLFAGALVLIGGLWVSRRTNDRLLVALLERQTTKRERNENDPRSSDGPDDAGASAPVGQGGPSGKSDGPPPETMTDAERVRKLLKENGGRIQQTTIIEQTDWSKSKVSRLLSKMEENGELEKISVGRENVITLPDNLPGPSRSVRR